MSAADAIRVLFHPGSVAIFGSFSSTDGFGCQFTRTLLADGYQGQVYPVNPRGGLFEGRLAIYPSLDEVGAPVDLAMIAVGPRAVESVVEDCARHSVKVGVIFTAGFAEIGSEGASTEARITARAREAGMRLVGPNCMSVFSGPAAMNLTSNLDIPAGHLGMLSQSGNVALSLWYDAARYNDVGFSRFIGFGNQADIAAHEYLAYMGEDPDTRAILVYLEGLRPGLGGAFLDVAREVARHKPIVVLKGGRTQAGNRAIRTHTAALATDASVYSAAFRQAGIVEVDRLDELLPVAEALMRCPPFTENKIAAVGSGGGHSIVVVDAAERAGFTVPPFSPELKPDITREMPHWAPWQNPIDMTGSFLEDEDRWGRLVQVALADPQGLGAAFVFGMYGYKASEPGMAGEWIKASESLIRAKQVTGRAVVLYTPYARERQPYLQHLRQAGIPVYDSAEIAARALRALYERGTFLARDASCQAGAREPQAAAAGVVEAVARGRTRLTEPEAARLLESYGLPVARHQVATSAAEAVASASALGYPVVLKVVSPDVLHKLDAGGVITGLDSASAVAAACEKIEQSVRSHVPGATIEGMLVAAQVQEGHEVIVGLSRQEPFGPVVMAGLGGVFVEVLKDVAFRVAPLSLPDARDMLAELKAISVLQGARGGGTSDLEALADLILKLASIAHYQPEIAEIDLNPVFVQPEGVVIADCRVLLGNAA